MKILSIMMLFIIISSTGFANEKAHWDYSDKMGPSHWAELDKHNFMCSKGKNQSPINIIEADSTQLEKIEFKYSSSLKNIVNNGHTVQINLNPGSTVKIKNLSYELKQFHFHTPSENTINGKSFPLEAHFVHQNKDGDLAVIAVMFKTTGENKVIATLWQALKEQQSKSNKTSLPGSALALLPDNKEYYRFNGSLTTPPCSEGVRWYVMKTPITVSKSQVEEFHHEIHHSNNRPVQQLNARMILQ
jgi:carbonic anhydrase